MENTKVKDLMTENPLLIKPETTLKDAARKMKEIDCGVLPVGGKEKLEGIITDRDIVIRAVAEGVDIERSTVEEYMSDQVYTCNENNTLKEAADIMRKHQVSRLVVNDREGKVAGILSFGCILRKDTNTQEIAEVIEHAVGNKAA